MGGHTGQRDTGRLHSQDLADAVSSEMLIKGLSRLIQESHIQLMVQKTVHLQDIARPYLPILQDPFFHKSHVHSPSLLYNNCLRQFVFVRNVYPYRAD